MRMMRTTMTMKKTMMIKPARCNDRHLLTLSASPMPHRQGHIPPDTE